MNVKIQNGGVFLMLATVIYGKKRAVIGHEPALSHMKCDIQLDAHEN